MASAALADPTQALQGQIEGSGPAMEEFEIDVESLEQLLLYADEHYLAGKLPLRDHLGKVHHGVEEYHQRNVGPLKVPRITIKLDRLAQAMVPQTIKPAVRAV
ncbi:15-hydroxyprostaglandin dehydrogenase [Trichonephila clavipes]|nr:15-hydroxyprostaglandin dehydrogenase [Trichonephila clavipes]